MPRAMMRGWIQIFALISALVASAVTVAAYGNTSADAGFSEIYSRNFDGKYEIPDLKHRLDSLIKYDRAACGDLVGQEVELINQYGIQASQSRRKQAISVNHKIHELLHAALVAPNQPCLDTVFKVYAVGSIFLLDPANYNLPKVTVGNGFTRIEGDQGMKESGDLAALSNFPLTYLAAALANRAKLRFFPEPVMTGGAAHEILGAYDCASSLIHLDPWLPPLDLGATFLHELDHLFLDKTFTQEELHAEFGNPDGSVNWRDFVLDDEFAAITHSAIAQKQMSTLPRSYWHLHLWGSAYDLQWSKYPYQLDSDLRLFSRDGAIASLDLLFTPETSTETLLALAAARNPQLSSEYLHRNFSQIGTNDPSVDAKFDQATSRIVDIVNGPYFPGDPLTTGDRELLSANRHGLEFIPLPTWIAEHQLEIKPVLASEETSKADTLLFTGRTQYFDSHNNPITAVSVNGMERLVRDIDTMLATLDQPSEVCKLYIDAVNGGALNGYIGTQLDFGSNGEPGASGGRPGASGGRPGASGGRPGASGGRPSGNIRPCLSLNPEL